MECIYKGLPGGIQRPNFVPSVSLRAAMSFRRKDSFSRLSRFAALAAISLRSPTSVSLSFFLSSPLAAAALVLSTSSSSTAKTTVSPLKRRSIWRPPPPPKRNSSSFFHVSPEIFLIFYCRQFQSVVRFGKNFVKIWLLLKWLASERSLWTL